MVHSLILCPVDFSAATALLVGYAATLARATGAELRLLHVRESAGQWPGATTESEARRLLRDWQRTACLAGTPRVSTALRAGEAAAEIVADATSYLADLIVIGAHGCTNLSRFLMGSTVEQVLRCAPCATLLLDQPSGARLASPA
jgi:nucleotide-binding universal stress UspA family protein